MNIPDNEDLPLEYYDNRLTRTDRYMPKANFETELTDDDAKAAFSEYVDKLEKTGASYAANGDFDAADRYEDQISLENIREQRYLLGAEGEGRKFHGARANRPDSEVKMLEKLDKLEDQTYERIHNRDLRLEEAQKQPVSEKLSIEKIETAKEIQVAKPTDLEPVPRHRQHGLVPSQKSADSTVQSTSDRLAPLKKSNAQSQTPQISKISGFAGKVRNDCVEYHDRDKQVAFTDNGKNIRIPNAKNEDALAGAMRLSGEKYKKFKLGGSQIAKERAATEAVKQGLGDRISNPELRDFIKGLQSQAQINTDSQKSVQQPISKKDDVQAHLVQSDAGKANQARIDNRAKEKPAVRIPEYVKNSLMSFKSKNADQNTHNEQQRGREIEKVKSQTE